MEHKYKDEDAEYTIRYISNEVFLFQVQRKSETETVCITECIDRKMIVRHCDPQSGSRIVAFPTYRVITVTAEKRTQEVLNMEEVHERYPWFFKALQH